MRVGVALLFLAIANALAAQNDFSGLTNELGAAREQFARGKLDAALAILDRLDKSHRTFESLDLRGCIYLEAGKLEEATKAFEAAHGIKFEAFAPKIHLADTLLRQKKFEEAGREYEQLTSINAPMWPEYARFGLLLTYLAQHDDPLAKRAFATIPFPTETAAYYYAQAAWGFAHGEKSEPQKWINSAKKIFDASKTSWFDRALFQFGWIKKKPAPAIDPFFY
ncbi:MAG: hypothetical protein ABI925_02830 [Verrucomicrobiota bacterium]